MSIQFIFHYSWCLYIHVSYAVQGKHMDNFTVTNLLYFQVLASYPNTMLQCWGCK